MFCFSLLANCSLEIEGLEVTLATENAEKPLFNSVQGESLLLSSIQIAEDFRKHGDQFQDESDEEKESVISFKFFLFFSLCLLFFQLRFFFGFLS